VPVIISSADSHNDAWAICSEVGVTDYLGKPFDEGKLISILDKYL